MKSLAGLVVDDLDQGGSAEGKDPGDGDAFPGHREEHVYDRVHGLGAATASC